jgi:HEAT repeat protein
VDRKSFRAPNTPAVYQRIRFDWLQRLLSVIKGYDQDITWLAAWAPYMGWKAATLGTLFAAAIELGGEDGDSVFDTLVLSARGEHEIGTMGRHVTTGLLRASRVEGWNVIEQLLLAGQRQEGLRQVILETVDQAHPDAFTRMVRLILNHNLTRFSATIRAADVWFGMDWESGDKRIVDDTLQKVMCFLEDREAQKQALEGEDTHAIYLALWTLAFKDVVPAWKAASQLLNDSSVEKRFVATHFLGFLGITNSQEALLSTLEDDDLRVVARALIGLRRHWDENLGKTDFFEKIERVVTRIPVKKLALEPIVWPWIKLSIDRQAVTKTLLWSLGSRSPKRLIPYLSMMNPGTRALFAEKLIDMPRQDTEVRDALFSLIGDRSHWVREQALSGFEKHRVDEQGAIQLEGLLNRKAGDLRRGVLSILVNQKDESVIDTVKRLLEKPNLQQRLAGLGLLRLMVEAERNSGRCRDIAARYQLNRTQLKLQLF